MSRIVTNGNRMPYGRPVSGFVDDGPVEPWQPPRTLAQTTKKRRVSTALPGPMRLFHQPGFLSVGACQPAQWWSPLNAWQMRIALSRVALSVPYVS